MTSPTEGTVNNLIDKYLSERGLNITAEVSAQIKDGRRQPDFKLYDAGDYYGEGEWKSSYITGYNQAIEYGDIGGASGYFVIGYPDELKKQLEQQRLQDNPDPETLLSGVQYRGMFKVHGEKPALFEGNLEEIPNWIENALSEGETTENAEEYIRLMQGLVEGLTDYIPEAEDYPSMFEHILADMPQNKSEFSAAKDAAAYLLLNQIVFYRILQDHGYPKLEPESINNPKDLKTQYFEEVLEVNYEAIFDLDVVNLIPPKAVEHLRDMIRIVNDLRPEEFTRDLLGSAFHEMIPLEVRKPVAAYYTNPMAARLLAELSVDNADDKIADLACGSGTLLMAGYEEKEKELRGSLTEDVHREFVEQELTGLDIMPFAAHMAAVQLGLRNPGYETDKPRIAIQDSTAVKPGDEISSLKEEMPAGQSSLTQDWGNTESEEVGHGAVSSSGEGSEFTLDSVDVVLMNPPFTRKQHINTDFRKELQSRFSDYSDYVHPEMGFYAYFLLLADRFLEEGGRIAMVLPSVILQQQTVEGVRELLQKKYEINQIVLSDYRSAFSEDTDFREILLVLTKKEEEENSEPARIASIDTLPSAGNVDSLASALLTGETQSVEDQNELLEITNVPQSDFQDTLDWMSIVRENAGFYFDYPSTGMMEPLGDEIDSMIGGIRYNASSDRVSQKDTMLSRERDADTRMDWRIESETSSEVTATSQYTAMEIDVPREVLGEGLRSMSGIRTMQVGDSPDKIVLDRFDGDDKFWDTDQPTEVVKKRNKHVSSRMCNLVIGGYGNLNLAGDGTSFLALVSESQIAPTWSMWAVNTKSLDQAKILGLWLNSTFSVAKMVTERNEVEGTTMKWRKTDLESLPVLSMSELTEDDTERLLDLYDELSETEFPPLMQQLNEHFEGRMKIDETWADILGWSEYRAPDSEDGDDEIKVLQSQVVGFLEELRMLMS